MYFSSRPNHICGQIRAELFNLSCLPRRSVCECLGANSSTASSAASKSFSGQKYKNTNPKIQKTTLRIVRVSVIVLRGAPLTGRPRYAPHYYSSVYWGAPIMTLLPLPDNHFFTHLLNSVPILSFQHIWRKKRGLLLFRELRTVREQMERGSIFKKFASNTKYEGGRANS